MPNQFDDLAEQLIEAALARVLGRRLDAGDVMRALVRALADARAAQSGGQGAAGPAAPPNHIWVSLNALDLQTLVAAEPGLADALSEQARQIMAQMGLRVTSAPRVLLQGLTHLAPRELRVTARWLPAVGDREQAVMPGTRAPLPRAPFLIMDGRRQVDLSGQLVRIGRARDCDVVVDDRRVSRHHLELRWDVAGATFLAVDAGSSGGTRLNGHPIKQCTLEAGDVLALGGYELIYGEIFSLSSTQPVPIARGTTGTAG